MAVYQHEFFRWFQGKYYRNFTCRADRRPTIPFAVDDGKFAERPKYSNLTNAFVTICRKEGVRGLYKGVSPNVAGAGTSWGFYFLL